MSINTSGMNAAMFNTPINAKTSVDYYKDLLQEKIDETYQFASDTYTIGEELTMGTLTFTDVECRVCHAIQPKTGLNLGDDFKDLKFFDLSKSPRTVGQRYQFLNSVWITTNTDNLHYVTPSAIVRRCNNTMNYIDSSGVVQKEPCIVDYAVKYANFYFNDTVTVPQGTINVITQSNDYTKVFQINDRFIFNNTAYKIKVIKNYLENYTGIVDSVPIITFEMYVDEKSPDDDFTINVANMDKYSSVYPPVTPVTTGVIISPSSLDVYQSESVSYSCYYYEDSVKQSNVFTFSFSGPSTEYYNAQVTDGNNFTLSSLSYSPTPLVVTCTSGSIQKTIEINLRGLF